MPTKQLKLKPGQTAADLLDAIEAATVRYMMAKFSATEKEMRDLIHSDPEIRASYHRKNARAKHGIIDMGMDPKVFA